MFFFFEEKFQEGDEKKKESIGKQTNKEEDRRKRHSNQRKWLKEKTAKYIELARKTNQKTSNCILLTILVDNLLSLTHLEI